MAWTSQSLIDQLKTDLRIAMKARESLRVATLRTMIAALDNATAVKVDTSFVPLQGRTPDVPRRELSVQEQLDILRAEAAGRRSAQARYESLGMLREAERIRAELEVFGDYLNDEVP